MKTRTLIIITMIAGVLIDITFYIVLIELSKLMIRSI